MVKRKRPTKSRKPVAKPPKPRKPVGSSPKKVVRDPPPTNPPRHEKEIAAWQMPPGGHSTNLPIRRSPSVPKPANDQSQSPLPAKVAAAGASAGNVQSHASPALNTPVPISITPTVYPEQPTGSVIVQNYVTINIQSIEFHQFEATLDDLLDHLRGSNQISIEARRQAIAEISAGEEILTAEKPDRGLVELLLIRPLKWIVEKGAGTIISGLATKALELLFKLMGLS